MRLLLPPDNLSSLNRVQWLNIRPPTEWTFSMMIEWTHFAIRHRFRAKRCHFCPPSEIWAKYGKLLIDKITSHPENESYSRYKKQRQSQYQQGWEQNVTWPETPSIRWVPCSSMRKLKRWGLTFLVSHVRKGNNARIQPLQLFHRVEDPGPN